MIQAARNCLFIVLAAVAALLILGGVAHAGHCRIKVRQQFVAQPVYAYPVQANVFYSVGEAARFEAILDKKLAALTQPQAVTPEAPQPAAEPVVGSVLKAKCAACHSGTTPKGGLLLDGSAPIDCETTLKAMRAVRDGEMPPKKPLGPDDAGVLFSELLDLSKEKP